jgi:hypothetical protein
LPLTARAARNTLTTFRSLAEAWARATALLLIGQPWQRENHGGLGEALNLLL